MSGVLEGSAYRERPVGTGETLLELDELVVEYETAGRPVRAVDHVNLTISAGETVGLAGESGCGKSTAGNAIMGILRSPASVTGGRILFRGEDISGLDREEQRRYRWRNVSMVFQSAMNALNPVMRVGDQFADMMAAHERINKKEALERAGDLLEKVGIDRRRVRSYPHQLSGGMRQRTVIAMALALSPELVIMDEPTTALDVVVQREILEEIQELQKELGFAVLFITHDLSLLVEFADRIAIMYAGEIVETAAARTLFDTAAAPVHGRADALLPPAHRPDDAPDRHSRLTSRSGASPGRLQVPPALLLLCPREGASLRAADDGKAGAPRGGARPLRRMSPGRGGRRVNAAATTDQTLEVVGLSKSFEVPGTEHFWQRRRRLHAVDDVSFTLRPARSPRSWARAAAARPRSPA